MTRITWSIAALLVIAACNSDNGYNTGPGGGSVGQDSVKVGNDFFSPVNVRPNGSGDVVWTWNAGSVTHHIIFEDTTIATSGDKSTGSMTRHFTADGVYRYRCTIHSSAFGSGMHGAVLVGAAAPPDTGGGGYGY